MARREWNAARNGPCGWLAKSAGFRRNPREHAGIDAIGQEKTPTENGWGFVIGGGGGNRTRVRKHSAISSTCLARALYLTGCYPTGGEYRRRSQLRFDGSTLGALHRELVRIDAWI